MYTFFVWSRLGTRVYLKHTVATVTYSLATRFAPHAGMLPPHASCADLTTMSCLTIEIQSLQVNVSLQRHGDGLQGFVAHMAIVHVNRLQSLVIHQSLSDILPIVVIEIWIPSNTQRLQSRRRGDQLAESTCTVFRQLRFPFKRCMFRFKYGGNSKADLPTSSFWMVLRSWRSVKSLAMAVSPILLPRILIGCLMRLAN